jgi:hypothetical protein
MLLSRARLDRKSRDDAMTSRVLSGKLRGFKKAGTRKKKLILRGVIRGDQGFFGG